MFASLTRNVIFKLLEKFALKTSLTRFLWHFVGCYVEFLFTTFLNSTCEEFSRLRRVARNDILDCDVRVARNDILDCDVRVARNDILNCDVRFVLSQ